MNPNHKQLVDANDPVLKAVAVPVQPGENLDAVMRKMKEVCARSKVKAAGLAAPQIGVSKRLIYICELDLFMINPRIVCSYRPYRVELEGCLSYPGKEKMIARCEMVSVRYESIHRVELPGLYTHHIARVVQHEIDHLNGICRVGDDSPADGVQPANVPELKL